MTRDWKAEAFRRYTDVDAARLYVEREAARCFAAGYRAIDRLLATTRDPQGKHGLPEAGDPRLEAVYAWALAEYRAKWEPGYQAIDAHAATLVAQRLACDEMYRDDLIAASGFELRELRSWVASCVF